MALYTVKTPIPKRKCHFYKAMTPIAIGKCHFYIVMTPIRMRKCHFYTAMTPIPVGNTCRDSEGLLICTHPTGARQQITTYTFIYNTNNKHTSYNNKTNTRQIVNKASCSIMSMLKKMQHIHTLVFLAHLIWYICIHIIEANNIYFKNV